MRRTATLADVRYDPLVTTLVPSGQPAADMGELRARVAERETALAEGAAEADRLNAELTSLAALYRHHVGTLHEQLDQLQLDIAEAELGILSSGHPVEPGRGDETGPDVRRSRQRRRTIRLRRASRPTRCGSSFATSPGRSIRISLVTRMRAPEGTP